MNLKYVASGKLPKAQMRRVKELKGECFGGVSREEIAEDFIARSFGVVLAYDTSGSMVGQISLHRRVVKFGGHRVVLGGLGGTCVAPSARHKGVGSLLVSEGLGILKERKYDIACLSANIRNFPTGGLYRDFGFKLRGPVAFTNGHGETKSIDDEFFAPVCSPEVYESVMNSSAISNVGKGYW